VLFIKREVLMRENAAMCPLGHKMRFGKSKEVKASEEKKETEFTLICL
jgi:hypothetical protein